ncbi:MAG: MBL fold metallo-hydrolase, partial [Myxococcales bacterium]|nr:MBL fold metallo-hydrolase [Myxococcales bacterium]
MPTQLLDFLRYLTQKTYQEQGDAQAAAELNWRRVAAPPLPRGLTLQWLGTSGFLLEHQGYALLIDPYASRVPLSAALSGAVVQPDRARIDRHLPRADAILIGHTHFDHAMDAPIVARRDGCQVYGSRSLATLMAAHGLA